MLVSLDFFPILRLKCDGKISFAGGLPNSELFPIDEISAACEKVLATNGSKALQYSNTEGDIQLREWIANRYQSQQGLTISPDNILICNGSQQAFDLIAKVLLNEGDDIAIELLRTRFTVLDIQNREMCRWGF